MRRHLLLLLIFVAIVQTYGQSPNINCATAFEITDPTSYCSNADEFDNTDAEDSGVTVPACWDDSQNDLWFSFVATDIAVNVAVNGEAVGDLNDPQIALYKGEDCNSIVDLGECSSVSGGSADVATLFGNDLIPGDRYYIRVSARFGRQGTFQICVLNYNPPFVPGQDCSSASILCDKSSFVVEFAPNAGVDEDEAFDSCLKWDPNRPSETNSTWFKWTCEESGTLTFDLTPLNISDDLDFAVFQINGIDNCDLQVLRCHASGPMPSQTIFDCGPIVGLDLTSTDLEEDFNCNESIDTFEDGYLRFLDMVAGESYALVINNFSDSEIGYNISFGGTGTFQGPIADFEVIPDPDSPCGTDFVINNLSTGGASNISELKWDFGEGSTPAIGTGDGPFNVSYATIGEKFIVLTVTSDLGCQVTEVRNVNLDECPESLSIVTDSLRIANCAGTGEGYIEVSGISGCPGYMFNIDGGTFSNTAIFDNLDMGNYIIGMMDMNGCETDTMIIVESAANFAVEAGDDVSIDAGSAGVGLEATTTASGDITISWDPSEGVECADGSDNCLNPEVHPTETTTYTITIMDGNGCVSSDMLTVFVDQCVSSTLELALDSIQSQICTNTQNGYIQVSAVNGELDYEYNIDGGPFGSIGIFNDLGIGQYTIGIRDGIGCVVDSIFTINPFPTFTVNAGDDITFDTPGDTIILNASTTTSNIANITWDPNVNIICDDGSLNCLNPMVRPSTNSGYTLTVTDENGCTATDVINLILVENTDIYIPNVFSPNEDGVNDFFSILGDPGVIESIEEFIIFDRWGNKMFQGNNLSLNSPESGWDGRLNGNKAKPGVYTWAAKVRFISKPDAEADQLSGSITLIR